MTSLILLAAIVGQNGVPGTVGIRSTHVTSAFGGTSQQIFRFLGGSPEQQVYIPATGPVDDNSLVVLKFWHSQTGGSPTLDVSTPDFEPEVGGSGKHTWASVGHGFKTSNTTLLSSTVNAPSPLTVDYPIGTGGYRGFVLLSGTTGPGVWRTITLAGNGRHPQVVVYQAGDADKNGVFNSADLVTAFIAGEYEDGIPNNSTWETGDWNGDGEFDTSDLVASFVAGGYVENAAIAGTSAGEEWIVISAE